MQQPIDAKGKKVALEERRRREADLEAQVIKLERAMQDDVPAVGCGGRIFGWMFGSKKGEARQGSTTQTASDQALFGQRASSSTSATDRLNKATESMSLHVESLHERAEATRKQAKLLMSAGKKGEAMMMLKRCKQTEKQLENAMATHSALERQVDVLAESALQKEVAQALTASVATAKKQTKGLLSKTEDAVDGAIELRDFAEDVASAFGGLQPDQFDDDELLEELQAMTASNDVELEEDSSVATAPEPQSGMATIDVSAFPQAPRAPARGRGVALERKSLLGDDSAAAQGSV